MKPAIEWCGVTKRYGRTRALDGLELAVPEGSICGLVGSNGAGKTTAMAIVAGMTRPDAGTTRLFGEGPFDAERHAGRLSLLPQDSELPREARPMELLTFYAALQGLDRASARSQATRMLEMVHLTDRARSPVKTLSHGMRKRIMIAQCFLGSPEVILLDEPLSGLDPREVARVRDFVRAERRRRTIVISSHNLHEIELLCDHVAFVEKGRTVRVDTLDAITGRQGVLVYALDREPPVPQLQAAAPGVAFECAGEPPLMTCRFDAAALTAADVNRLLLPVLLAAGIGVLEVRQGERLESEYLRQSGVPGAA